MLAQSWQCSHTRCWGAKGIPVPTPSSPCRGSFFETNTLPGLTQASFIPQQLAAATISFERFVQDQLSLAVARRERALSGSVAERN